LINPAELRTLDDWTKAGQRVFREIYLPPSGADNNLISLVRSREALRRAGITAKFNCVEAALLIWSDLVKPPIVEGLIG
jgi:hypothetical protein